VKKLSNGVNRDYSLTGKDIKVAIYDDMVEVTSPGLLPPSIDYGDMESRQSDARNKVIAPVFKQLGIIDQWGFNLAGGGAGAYMFWFMPFVWGNGGSMFDNDGNVTLDSYETVEALQFWHDLIHEYKIAPVSSVQYGSGDRYNAFVSGKLAMYLGGNFNITSLRKDAPNMEFGVTPIPKNRAGFATFGGGSLLGITSQCKEVEAAQEFMAFIYSDEAQIEAYAPNLQLLARPSLYDNKYYNEIPQMAAFADILGYALTPYSTNYNEIYDPVQFYFESVFLDKMDAQTAVEKCTEEIKKIMNK
jgi:multiple sugar transport system substrate-binding protein